MDFFANTSSPFNESASPLGKLIVAATDATLSGPDWSKNMEICDFINDPSSNNADAERAAKTLIRRFQEADSKIIGLSLTLAETCMKNCQRFAKVVDQAFMDEMVGITRGAKGKENSIEALRMIQEWAKGLPQKEGGHSAFHDTYNAMKTRGVSFPEMDESPATFEVATPGDMVRPRMDVEFTSKLENDLATVFEKIKLCREMLLESPGIEEDDALAEVIGFLEACRDRMADVIEAGTQGLLSEELLAQCFRANDAIFRTLDAEKNGLRIAVDDDDGTGGSAEKPSSTTTTNLLDLLDEPTTGINTAAAGKKVGGPSPSMSAAMMNDDDFGSLKRTTGVAVPLPIPPVAIANPSFINSNNNIPINGAGFGSSSSTHTMNSSPSGGPVQFQQPRMSEPFAAFNVPPVAPLVGSDFTAPRQTPTVTTTSSAANGSGNSGSGSGFDDLFNTAPSSTQLPTPPQPTQPTSTTSPTQPQPHLLFSAPSSATTNNNDDFDDFLNSLSK